MRAVFLISKPFRLETSDSNLPYIINMTQQLWPNLQGCTISTVFYVCVTPASHLFDTYLRSVRHQCSSAMMTAQGSKEEQQKGQKESKGSRFRKALSKPIGPPNPESKHTAIHVRLTYRELSVQQVHPSRISHEPHSIHAYSSTVYHTSLFEPFILPPGT
jgi:hypothetical protein